MIAPLFFFNIFFVCYPDILSNFTTIVGFAVLSVVAITVFLKPLTFTIIPVCLFHSSRISISVSKSSCDLSMAASSSAQK